MSILNVEIKARCNNPDYVHKTLRELGADYKGLDHQIDTYFAVPRGRLKLREGNIENALIFYEREDQAGPKQSNIRLAKLPPESGLKAVLAKAIGTRVVVDKQRHIYFIDNVKFHIDDVAGLGSFVEIEAIDTDASRGKDALDAQCKNYMPLLNIAPEDLLVVSYSDLLMNK